MPWKSKEAHNVYAKKRYNENPEFREKHKIRTRASDARRKLATKALVAEFQKNGCALCEEKVSCCLSAHHLDPSQKDFTVSQAIGNGVGVEKVKAELAKCVCLCANCHSKVHAGILEL